MPTRKDDDSLIIGVGVDVKDAIRQMAKFQNDMNRLTKRMADRSDAFYRSNKKHVQEGAKDSKKLKEATEDLTEAYEEQSEVITELERQLQNANGAEQKALEKQINLLKQANKERAKRNKSGAGGRIKDWLKTESMGKIGKNLGNQSKKAYGNAKDGAKAFMAKDLKGAITAAFTGSSRVIRTVFETSLKSAARGFDRSGRGLMNMGGRLSERGRARGGVGGGAMRAAGGGMKMFGNLVGKFAPIIQAVSKLGPLLTTTASIIMKVVTAFVDAEAQAKQFQKEILQSASTIEFLGSAGGNVEDAMGGLEATLHGVRSAAYDLENLKWGISAEEHKAVVNVLNQEGVSLNRIGQEASDSGKSVKEFAANLTHVSVAYSRAFGVPLQEINQLQSEMMTDLGMSLDETKLAFSQMTRAATDSGIAGNKFFAIIRGVSQDLSLYNNRMEDAVRMLKMLGKVMNPREAQKFMSVAMQGLKTMGRQERLRMTMLAGPAKMGALVDRDLKRSQDGIAKKISMHTGKSIAEIEDTLKKGPAAVESLVKTLPDEVQGSIREGLGGIKRQKKRRGRGLMGISGAAANLGPAAALEAMQSALAGWGGGKTLNDGLGTLGMEMMAENLGISQEQLDQMASFEDAIDSQRNLLVDQLKNGTEEQKVEAREALKRAGLTAKTDEELTKKVHGAGYDQIMDTLDEGTKEQLKNSNKVESLGEKQGRLTTSLLDKLTVLVDFMMNQVYDVLSEVYTTLLDLAGVFGVVKDVATLKGDQDVRRMAAKTGVKELGSIASSANRPDAIRESQLYKAMSSAMKDSMDAEGRALGNAEALTDMLFRKASSPAKDWSKDDEEYLKKLQATANADEILATKNKTMGVNTAAMFPEQMVLKALTKAGVDKDPQGFANSIAAGGGGMQGMRSALGQLDTKDLAKTLGALTQITDSEVTGASKFTMQALESASKDFGSAGYYDAEKGQAIDPKILESTSKSSEKGASAMDEVAEKGARQKESLAVKFGNTYLNGKYKNTIEEAVLEAMRLALFEYYLYSEIEDRQTVADYFKSNPAATPSGFAKMFSDGAKQGAGPSSFLGVEEAPANAAGGLVTGINGGLAMVQASAGEGLASIGRGERIVPAGGGATNVSVAVNGIGGRDLEQLIRARVIDGIAEYKRRERYT